MTKNLIIRGGAVGDFVLTLPVFEAVRALDPMAEIEILGYSGIAELAVGRRHAERMRRVDGAEWAPVFSAGGELRDGERAYLRGFGRVIVVWPDGDGTIRENLARAGAEEIVWINPMPPEGGNAVDEGRVVVKDNGDGTGETPVLRSGECGGCLHVVEYVAEQCARAGMPVKYVEPQLYPSERDRWWVERYMRVTTAGERPLLGLAPGSGSPRKNWPAAGFIEVAKRWIGRSGHVLIFGGPADDGPIEEVRRALGEECGAFYFLHESLPHVAAAIERCEVFVGNDSGLTHIAAAVRTPTVALFGPTNPDVWRPRGPRARVVRAEGGMESIEVGRVVEQIMTNYD